MPRMTDRQVKGGTEDVRRPEKAERGQRRQGPYKRKE